MKGYKRVCRCKQCGKIYESGIPDVCVKCGTEIGTPTPFLLQEMGLGKMTLTDKCEKVIAKKTMFGWKVRRNVE